MLNYRSNYNRDYTHISLLKNHNQWLFKS